MSAPASAPLARLRRRTGARRCVVAAAAAALAPVLVAGAAAGEDLSFTPRPVPQLDKPAFSLAGGASAVFSTRGLITKLAADGNRAAVLTTGRPAHGRIVVWKAPGRTSTSFDAGGHPSILCGGGAACIDELALGEGQVGWIRRSGGNSLQLSVRVRKLSSGVAKEVDLASNGYGAGGDPSGTWVGHLIGAGSLLVYNGWKLVCARPRDYVCSRPDPELHRQEERLVRISAGRRRVLARGAGGYAVTAVGGGRVALESAGVVTVLGSTGSRLATIPADAADPPRAVALSKRQLAVTRTLTVDLYSPTTGSKLRSLPLGAAARLQLAGMNANLAVLHGPRRLVLIRLRDGKLISLPLRAGAGTGIVDASLTEAGLFYAYNAPRSAAKGRIVFEPTSRLLARF